MNNSKLSLSSFTSLPPISNRQMLPCRSSANSLSIFSFIVSMAIVASLKLSSLRSALVTNGWVLNMISISGSSSSYFSSLGFLPEKSNLISIRRIKY